MPLYEYECKVCKTKFEEIKSINDSDDSTCPNCEAVAKKVVSGFALAGKSSSFNYNGGGGGGGCYGGG